MKLKPWTFNALRHGHARHSTKSKSTPTYRSWQGMLSRIRYKSRHNHNWYAELGVCDRWRSFDNFLEDMGERPEGKTIDRIDNKKGYSPDNCRWSTPTEQARNTRRTKLNFNSAVEVAIARLSGEKLRSISKRFGISENMPNEILKGRCWKDARAKAISAWNRRTE